MLPERSGELWVCTPQNMASRGKLEHKNKIFPFILFSNNCNILSTMPKELNGDMHASEVGEFQFVPITLARQNALKFMIAYRHKDLSSLSAGRLYMSYFHRLS